MPSLITHCHFAEEAYKKLKKTNVELDLDLSILRWGAQAGDIFFYEGALPWSKKLNLSALGSKMHKQQINEFFAQLLGSLTNVKKNDSLTYQVYLAYVMGYIAHYYLDTQTHPFVFYWSGNDEVSYHIAFEAALDVFFLPAAHRTDIHKWIEVGLDNRRKVAEILAQDITSVYHESLIKPEDIIKAHEDMIKVYKLTQDKTGYKRKIIKKIERLIKPPGYLTANIYPQLLESGIDYLNNSHEQWTLPWDDTVVSNASFIDLYNQALELTVELWQELLSGLQNKQKLLELLGNKNFSTGLDCSIQVEFRFQNVREGIL